MQGVQRMWLKPWRWVRLGSRGEGWGGERCAPRGPGQAEKGLQKGAVCGVERLRSAHPRCVLGEACPWESGDEAVVESVCLREEP